MKKLIKYMSVILCLALALFSLVSCSDPGAPDHYTEQHDYAVSADSLSQELDMFMEGAGNDRTSFTYNEKLAAVYIQNRLTDLNYDDVTINEFVAEESGVKHTSQNVVTVYKAKNSSSETKNIVIAAYYDNRYSDDKTGVGYKSAGALANGTGTAALISIADYLMSNAVELDFDVTFAFIGAGYISDVGARAFYRDMTADERKNTVLMVELQRLGGDHIYAYSDVRKTKREPFLDGIAAANGLDIYKVTQKSPLITDAYSLDGVPFFQWAQSGLFTRFDEGGIPTLNIVGANWETMNMTDIESANNDNISYTTSDNLESLKKIYPDYAQKMATAATLMIRAIEHEDFLGVMQYDRDNYPDTSILTKSWIWYLIMLGIIIAFAVGMFVVTAVLNKKYPIKPVEPPRMKMAVFGMDYEDKSAADIFVDISNAAEEIFPGIPNNDGSQSPNATDPFDDIFPPIVAPVGGKINDNANVPDDTNTVVESDKTDARSSQETESNVAEDRGESEEKDAERSEQNTVSDKKTYGSDKSNEKPVTVEHKPIKRKTVSAGKSNTAKKSSPSSGNKKNNVDVGQKDDRTDDN